MAFHRNARLGSRNAYDGRLSRTACDSFVKMICYDRDLITATSIIPIQTRLTWVRKQTWEREHGDSIKSNRQSHQKCKALHIQVVYFVGRGVWLDNVYKLLQHEFENFLETSAIYWFNSVYITSNLFSIRQKTVTKWSLLIIIPCFYYLNQVEMNNW